jgi:hypothetical protein
MLLFHVRAGSVKGSALPRDLPAVSTAHVSTTLPAPPFLLIPAPLRQFRLGQADACFTGTAPRDFFHLYVLSFFIYMRTDFYNTLIG